MYYSANPSAPTRRGIHELLNCLHPGAFLVSSDGVGCGDGAGETLVGEADGW